MVGGGGGGLGGCGCGLVLGLGDVPLLRERILTWFPASGSVRASSVGAKNMASSSGWAMRRQMRLLRSWGKEVRVMCAV